MARINTVGLTELARELQQRENNTRPTVERMLNYAGEEIAKAVKINAEMYGLVDTGVLVKSIKPGNLEIHTDSASVEVWPQGSRKRGSITTRNALIGFVQHYGRSYGTKKRPGRPFFDDGFEASAGMVQKLIEEAIEDD